MTDRPMCRKGLHYLDVPDATLLMKDGRRRCRECNNARTRKWAAKRRQAEAEAAAAEAAEAEARRRWAATRRPPASMSREQAALHRHGRMVREQRGYLPPAPAPGPGRVRRQGRGQPPP